MLASGRPRTILFAFSNADGSQALLEQRALAGRYAAIAFFKENNLLFTEGVEIVDLASGRVVFELQRWCREARRDRVTD